MQHFGTYFVQIIVISSKCQGSKDGPGGNFMRDSCPPAPLLSASINLANFMSSNFMTHKPSDIAQLIQMTKNKFNNIKLVNNWIKCKLDPVLKSIYDKLRLKFKYGR